MAKKKKRNITKDGKMIIKIDTKYRITTQEEMESFLHTKRKGASQTKNGRAYRRHDKHKQRIAA